MLLSPCPSCFPPHFICAPIFLFYRILALGDSSHSLSPILEVTFFSLLYLSLIPLRLNLILPNSSDMCFGSRVFQVAHYEMRWYVGKGKRKSLECNSGCLEMTAALSSFLEVAHQRGSEGSLTVTWQGGSMLANAEHFVSVFLLNS